MKELLFVFLWAASLMWPLRFLVYIKWDSFHIKERVIILKTSTLSWSGKTSCKHHPMIKDGYFRPKMSRWLDFLLTMPEAQTSIPFFLPLFQNKDFTSSVEVCSRIKGWDPAWCFTYQPEDQHQHIQCSPVTTALYEQAMSGFCLRQNCFFKLISMWEKYAERRTYCSSRDVTTEVKGKCKTLTCVLSQYCWIVVVDSDWSEGVE